MKKFIAGVACFVCVAVYCLLPLTALAELIISPRASLIIDSTSISMNTPGSGTVRATASIACKMVADKVGFIVIKIQEKSGSSWVTVATATDKYKNNASIHSYTLSYNGVVGREYRGYTEGYAKSGSIEDDSSVYSSSVIAK